MSPSSLKNLGPSTEAMLAAIGVETAEQVRDLGAPYLYRLLRHRFGSRANRVLLWALAGAIEDRHWASFSPAEKAALDAAASGTLEVRGTHGRAVD